TWSCPRDRRVARQFRWRSSVPGIEVIDFAYVLSESAGHDSPRMVLKQAGEGRTAVRNTAIIHCQDDSYEPLNMVNPATRSSV
ncbi:MAG: hypothetical protein AAB385_07560, partial [Planctomycetota bacterium]